MKKYFNYFSLIITMLLSCTFFAGCDLFNSSNKNNNVTQLTTPIAPIVKVENGEIIVSTFDVANASSYQLLINGIPYNSQTPSFNCTSYLVSAGEYKFKIVALGVGNYSNSKYSAETSYAYLTQFSAPKLLINESQILWGEIAGANEYEIFVNEQSVLTTTETSVRLLSNEIKNCFEQIGDYSICVRACATTFNTASEVSNVVTYKVTKQIDAPSNLRLVEQSERIVLKWDSVQNAENYVVMIDGTAIQVDEPIIETEFDVTQYLTQIKNYYFRVKAEINNEFLFSSNLSNEITYSKTLKLSSPVISASLTDKSVNISWQAVEFAQSYSVYINDEKYNRDIWQTSDIINAVILKSYLNSFKKPLKFKVIANGYENYIASDFSNIETISQYGKLNVPTNIEVVKNDGLVELTFNAINNAETYSVLIDDLYLKTTSSTKVDLSEIINEPRTYEIKVKCNQTDNFEESDYSEIVQFSNTGKLATPILEGEFDNNSLNFSWMPIENATSYTITIIHNNGVKQTSVEIPNLTETTYSYEISEAGEYIAYIFAIGNELYENSSQSEQIRLECKLSLPCPTGFKVNVDNKKVATISWNYVKNAVSYILYITCNGNQKSFNSDTNTYIFDLSTETDGVYIFNIVSVAGQNTYYNNSDLSLAVCYVHGDPDNIGETYYYHGEERDFYIEDQEELNHVISWAILYKVLELDLEILFDYTLDLTDEYYYENVLNLYKNYSKSDETIHNEIVTALYSYNRDMGGWNGYTKIKHSNTSYTFKFSYFSDTGEPNTSSSQEEVAKSETNAPLTVEQWGYKKRTKTYDAFYIETISETVDVRTSNQLVEALSIPNRKPNFVIPNSNAERVYNIAKEILREIIADEMTEFEKVTAIFDWLVYNVTYDHAAISGEEEISADDYYCYYAEGVFYNRIAVCNGISKAFCVLCGIEGIETRHIVGTMGGSHAWNKVKIDGNWYMLDPTNGSTSLESKKVVAHYRNFLKSDEQADLTHIEHTAHVPDAESALSYYDAINLIDSYDLYIESVDEMQNIAQLLFIERGVQGIDIQYAESITVAQIYNAFASLGITIKFYTTTSGGNAYGFISVA